MKRFALLLIVLALFGCVMTPNVNNRKASRPWNYYGDLVNVYRDQTGGAKVALVWLDQVLFLRADQRDFQKTVRTYMTAGYRKIGFVSVRSQYFVDPYSVKKLAADKGARLVIGCWFTARESRSKSYLVDYWYQLLDKSAPPPPSVLPPRPTVTPVAPVAPTGPIGMPQPGSY